MIRKGQARWVSGSDVRRQIQFLHRLFEVAHETEPGRLDQSLSCRFWKVATHPGIAETQTEPMVESDRVADDVGRESISVIAGSLTPHRPTLPLVAST